MKLLLAAALAAAADPEWLAPRNAKAPLALDGPCARWAREAANATCAAAKPRVLVLLRGHSFRDRRQRKATGACGCDAAVEAQRAASASHVRLLAALAANYSVDAIGATYACPPGAKRADADVRALYAGAVDPLIVEESARANQWRAFDDLVALATIQANLSEDSFPSTVGSIWKSIAAEGIVFEGITFQGLSDGGQVLDGSAFENIPFKEGKSLKYEPKQEAVAAE